MADVLTFGQIVFGDDQDRSHWLVRRLASLPIGEKCLRELAVGRRALVELELADRLAGILRADLGDAIVGVWSRCNDVAAGLVTSQRHPTDKVVVPLTRHAVKWSERPVVEVYLGAARLGRVELDALAELTIEGAQLELVAGRAERVLAGEWSATASLSVGGSTLVRRASQHHRLHGALRLSGLTTPVPAPGGAASRLVVDPAPAAGPARVEISDKLVIGRHPSCGLVLWDDPAIVNHHAAIHVAGDAVILEDLGSPAGTSLNGRRITAPALLRAGDLIGLGRRRVAVD